MVPHVLPCVVIRIGSSRTLGFGFLIDGQHHGVHRQIPGDVNDIAEHLGRPPVGFPRPDELPPQRAAGLNPALKETPGIWLKAYGNAACLKSSPQSRKYTRFISRAPNPS